MKAGVPFDRGKMEKQQECVQRLQECQNSRALDRLHASLAGIWSGESTYLDNWLIHLHGKLGNSQRSREVFEGVRLKNVYSWSMMIGAYAQDGHRREAIALFRRMQSEGVRPNSVTCIHVLSACCSRDELPHGRRIHAYISSSECKRDRTLQTALINMYVKCGSPVDARKVFDEMAEKDIVAWNAMAGAFIQNGVWQESLKLLRQMDLQGVKPNASTYSTIIRGCTTSASATRTDCKAIEQRIIASGFLSDVSVQNALVNLHAKAGDLQSARRVFDKMECKDVISWSSMISAYTQSGKHTEALDLFKVMESDSSVKPNSVTFVGVIGACTGTGNLLRGRQVHGTVASLGLEADVAVGSALMQMYTKGGSLEDTKSVFDRVKEKDVLCWNFMLLAYSDHGLPEQVVEAYEAMDVEANAVTYTNVLIACSAMEDFAKGREVHSRIVDSGVEMDMTMETALLRMYIKCKRLEDARRVFEDMANKDVVAWNFMMVGLIDQDCDADALAHYSRMQEAGIEANNVTFASVFKACSKIRDLETGRKVEASLLKRGFETDAVTDTALLNMYAACGDLQAAREVFVSRRSKRREVIFWTAMIASFAQAGQGGEALALFKQMPSEAIKPNSVTYTSVFTACSILGDIQEGRRIHADLQGTPEELDLPVQNSLLSMYSRCGSLQESWSCFEKIRNRDAVSWTAMVAAYAHHGRSDRSLELVQEMELSGVAPDSVTFQSVLHACSHQGSLYRGWMSFVSMSMDYGVEPSKDHYLCMVDLLARAGRLEEAREVIEFVGVGEERMGWMMLLGACKLQRDLEMGMEAARGVSLDDDGFAMCALLCKF